MVRAVALGGVADHLVAAALVEVHVDVGHLDAVGVQEPLEQQPVAQRVEVGDPQRVGDDRPRRGAAARSDPDPLLAREPDQVPHDQEVPREPHVGDHRQLVVQPIADLLRQRRAVPVLGAAVHEGAQVGLERLAARRLEPRQVVLGLLAHERALQVLERLDALGDQERRVARLGQLAERAAHLLGALEVELLRVEPQPLRVGLQLLLLDAQEHVVRLSVTRRRVVQVVRGDDGDPDLGGDRHLLRDDRSLVRQPMVLQLHEVAVRPEDVPVLPRRARGPVPLPGDEGDPDLGREASREADDPLRVLGEQGLVHPRAVVEALEVGLRHEPEQVAVPGLVLGQERQVVVLLLALAGGPVEPRARRHVRLDPDDRRDARGPRGLVEPERAEHGAVVRDRQRRHPHPGGFRDDRRAPPRWIGAPRCAPRRPAASTPNGHGGGRSSGRTSALVVALPRRVVHTRAGRSWTTYIAVIRGPEPTPDPADVNAAGRSGRAATLRPGRRGAVPPGRRTHR